MTASDRLARHLHELHAREQLAAGRRAWERPEIVSVAVFWRRLLAELQENAELPLAGRRLLGAAAVQCRWESLVAQSFSTAPLLGTNGAARSALEAWRLCREYRLDLAALAADPLEETRLLVEWGTRFERECAANGWLPDYAAPDAVLATLEQSASARSVLPRRIVLAGFVDAAPAERARWEAMQALGVAVSWQPPRTGRGRVVAVAFTDPRAEVDALAAWLRARLFENPARRIAVIVPALAERRDLVRRALDDALAPARLLDPVAVPSPFNVSLGEPLAERALVADALALLSCTAPSLEFAAVARLCRSPYLAPAAEFPARLALERVLRDGGYAQFSPAQFAWLAARGGAPHLAEALRSLQEAARGASAERLPSAWARELSGWLALFGWCRGRELDSAEFQARDAFNDTLARLGELDAVLGRCARGVALGWLGRLLQETPFQPRALDAPVQVLGLLEATGMQFDAAWLLGMSDDVLPAAPRPNPFLPAELQRAKGLPQSSAARELAFARDILDGIFAAAPEVVVSHAQHEGDAERSPSPLLKGITRGLPDSAAVTALARSLFDARAAETLDDDRGARHPGGRARGGTALLQDQSRCAFRAYALHRLGAAEWPTPAVGPDARTRGLVVHRVMEALWRRWRTRDALAQAMERGEFETALAQAVELVVNEAAQRERHRWTVGLAALERERLAGVLARWFRNAELPRDAFTVIETEGITQDGVEVETHVRAGPLELRGKLDRVDRLADGRELIIDYKTGDAPRRNDFFGARPAAPQLPAYLLARAQAGRPLPAAIAVASLKTGREGLQGIGKADGDAALLPGLPGIENVARCAAVDSWEEAVAHWQANVDALGEAFAGGAATVDPLPGACDYCHLATFCRISERREFAEGDGDE